MEIIKFILPFVIGAFSLFVVILILCNAASGIISFLSRCFGGIFTDASIERFTVISFWGLIVGSFLFVLSGFDNYMVFVYCFLLAVAIAIVTNIIFMIFGLNRNGAEKPKKTQTIEPLQMKKFKSGWADMASI